MVYDICVVGGGASGMTAALTAGRRGARVLLLERMDRCGKKIPATGNGRCNLSNTHLRMNEINNRQSIRENYHCGRPGFVQEVLPLFDMKDTLDFFRSIGIYTSCEGEYVYPLSRQAAAVRRALEEALAALPNVEIRTGIKVSSAGQKGHIFQVTDGAQTFRAKRLILSAGGCAQPALGSDGSGYQLCRDLGLRIIAPVPALCGLTCREKFFKDIAGVRVQGRVDLYAGSKALASDQGELMLTKYGISGIPVFQVSRFAAAPPKNGRPLTATLRFLPQYTPREIAAMLRSMAENCSWTSAAGLLGGLLPEKLGICILRGCGIDPASSASRIRESGFEKLSRKISAFIVTVDGTTGFEHAQVTAGGADTAQIDPRTLEAVSVPGLYITGELLDVDGICGGYNLQWAWSTGYLAGRAACGGNR